MFIHGKPLLILRQIPWGFVHLGMYRWMLGCLVILVIHSCGSDLPLLPGEPSSALHDPFLVTTEDSLGSAGYAARIEKFYRSGEEGTFEGAKRVSIRYMVFRQDGRERGAVMVSSGRTESALKYKELVFDLYRNGYTVYIHDHRGQGLSGRMTGDREMGHVDRFLDYVEDMHAFYEMKVRPSGHQKLYLLAHSMGGAIGMSFLQEYPEVFDAAVFSSPMLGLKPPACLLAAVIPGNRARYAPGQSGYRDWPFEGNTVTGSEIRFQRARRELEDSPEIRLGGVSLGWVKESCGHFRHMRSNITSIETPFLLLSGELEEVVDPRAHIRFIRLARKQGRKCEAYLVKGARHELFMEKDLLRTPVLRGSLEYFGTH